MNSNGVQNDKSKVDRSWSRRCIKNELGRQTDIVVLVVLIEQNGTLTCVSIEVNKPLGWVVG